ncbi:hypothetical protein PVAP13_7NG158617 [Panicum virgatum]|uniref:Uncharacterized protein n=1 Tax=Panicum virgatum TaxID=38727 RepID=A0A8T0Q4M0_PANVG|nr:hypothetical protein PVAP13_7NG158617 [Panicum virgatum]
MHTIFSFRKTCAKNFQCNQTRPISVPHQPPPRYIRRSPHLAPNFPSRISSAPRRSGSRLLLPLPVVVVLLLPPPPLRPNLARPGSSWIGGAGAGAGHWRRGPAGSSRTGGGASPEANLAWSLLPCRAWEGRGAREWAESSGCVACPGSHLFELRWMHL